MTDRRPDPVDALLAGLRVPPPSPDLADRIAAAAQRADRVPSLADAPPRRPRGRRWTRRSAWTAVLAINLMLASAVAAALGSGAIDGPRLVAAARHVVERFRHPVATPPSHRTAVHHRLPLVAPPPTTMVPRAPERVRPAIERPLPVVQPLVPRPVRVMRPPRHLVAEHRIARVPRVAAERREVIRPAWRQQAFVGRGARRFDGARGFPAEGPRRRFGMGRRFDRPGFAGSRFGRGDGFAPPRFRGGGRFRRPGGGRRVPPRRRF